MINFDYIKADSVRAAADTRRKQSASQFIAGGTNLVDLMKKGVASPQTLIDINGLPLNQIKADDKGVKIGALALNSDVANHEIIKSKFPLLAQALNAGASAQVRNMATMGGNIMQRTRCTYFYDPVMPCNKRSPGSGCGALDGYNRMHAVFGASNKCIAVHPSDMCVALAALDAKVVVSNGKTERTISFADFHRLPGDTPEQDNNLQPGELITAIHIPNNTFNKHHYLKIRDRASYAFALIAVAVSLEVKGNSIQSARLVMGGVAHKPWRLPVVENFLKGKNTTASVFKEAGELAMQDAKTYAHNGFKIKLGKAAVQEALAIAVS